MSCARAGACFEVANPHNATRLVVDEGIEHSTLFPRQGTISILPRTLGIGAVSGGDVRMLANESMADTVTSMNYRWAKDSRLSHDHPAIDNSEDRSTFVRGMFDVVPHECC